jgi:hypothetical protein
MIFQPIGMPVSNSIIWNGALDSAEMSEGTVAAKSAATYETTNTITLTYFLI